MLKIEVVRPAEITADACRPPLTHEVGISEACFTITLRRLIIAPKLKKNKIVVAVEA